MKLFKELKLMEAEKASNKELRHTINLINEAYNEWKKVKRRVNAVDIVVTTANKLSTISPQAVNRIHEASRVKLTALLMRCMDVPYWKPLGERAPIYKKIYKLIDVLSNYDARTGNGSTLKEVILTRLSAAHCFQNKLSDGSIVFVAYESKISDSYLRYLFGSEKESVVVTYKMQTLSLPQDYASLLEILSINHEKAIDKYKKQNKNFK
jgi:hypothetical protein